MSQISNIDSFGKNFNIQDKSNDSMQVGQVFNAKIVENKNGEVVIDLGSGNKISAKVDGNVNIDLNQTNKFVVEGYDNGEIKVKLLSSSNSNSNLDSKIDGIIKQCFGNSANEADYAIVKELMDSGIPLTKDNVMYVKNLIDFQNKLSSTQSSANQFINTYFESRNIDLNTEEGGNASSKILQFVNELKNLDLKDIAAFIENNIDVNSDNINSFNSIFKGEDSIFNELSQIKSQIENNLLSKMDFVDSIKNDVLKIIMGSSKEGGISMPGIVNVNNKIGTENRSTRKLSFEVGEVFSGKADSIDSKTGEAIIRLSDGWKFSAKLDTTADMAVNQFSRFVVEGYEDGNLKIRKLQSDNKDTVESKSSENIDDILLKFAGDGTTDEDLSIMKSLLKHNIPLTKENISYEKNIMDFKQSIIANPEKEDQFIDAYLKGKGIDSNSTEAADVKSTIKQFFSELKGMDMDEITTFIENGLDFTDENIKSFKNIFQNDASISKDINAIKQEIENLNGSKIEPKEAQINMKNGQIVQDNSKILAKDVLNEINTKINDMKDTIKQLTSFSDLNKNGMENILNTLNKNINDFKVFNTMSEGYYYMDVPVNLKENEYNCKLIIKDDRKSGKKIDTKNVKIATSVKTINMGVVDAYITILNKNLKVDIKADKKWTKVLDLAKMSLMGKLHERGYNINVNIDNKDEELNIVTCRKFFNNDKVGNLDIRV